MVKGIWHVHSAAAESPGLAWERPILKGWSYLLTIAFQGKSPQAAMYSLAVPSQTTTSAASVL
jgi:hypothetical protein